MKKLILAAGLYFLVEAGIAGFHFVERFASYNFSTAYNAGFATGQALAPLAFLAVGIIFVVHGLRRRTPGAAEQPVA
jgi:hypothetical protein